MSSDDSNSNGGDGVNTGIISDGVSLPPLVPLSLKTPAKLDDANSEHQSAAMKGSLSQSLYHMPCC